MSTRRSELTRQAARLFAAKGYDATSVDDIAKAAGIATGAFYRFFRSKRQLLLVLMNELLQRLEDVDLRPQGDLRDFLLRIFSTDLEYFGVIRAWQEGFDLVLRLGHLWEDANHEGTKTRSGARPLMQPDSPTVLIRK